MNRSFGKHLMSDWIWKAFDERTKLPKHKKFLKK